MPRPTDRFILIATLIAISGCEGGEPALEVQVARVDRTRIVLDVKTAPGHGIGSHRSPEVEVGEDGHAEWTIDVPDDGPLYDPLKGGTIVVNVIRESALPFVDPEVVAQESLRLAFMPSKLRKAPTGDATAWTTFVGFDPLLRSGMPCLTFESKDVGGGQVDMDGGPFMARPGTRVSIGADAFTVGESGLHTWVPSAARLAGLATADLRPIVVPVTATRQDAAQLETTATLELMKGCQKAIGGVFRDAVAARKWTLGNSEEDFIVATRANGELHTVGSGGDRKLVDAKWLLVEEEVSRDKQVEQCRQQTGLRYEGGGDVTTPIRPENVTTRVTLYELPSLREVGSGELSPEKGGCKREILPASSAVDELARTLSKS